MSNCTQAELESCRAKLIAVGATDAKAGFHERYGGFVGWFEVEWHGHLETGRTLTEAVDKMCDHVRSVGGIGAAAEHE